MRLSDFIHEHHAKILAEWVAFAREHISSATEMTDAELRDHADELLTAVVSDMHSPQNSAQQSEKSKGQATEGRLGQIGHKHAIERLKSGFKLDQLVAEYRALRARVLRLWDETHCDKQGEITRFNEAIDETLAEATTWYSASLNRTREELTAVLGHDLRSPLTAIQMSASTLVRSGRLDDRDVRSVARILNSAERMSRMVGDLLDLTRARLGGGILVTPKPMNLAAVCEQVLGEVEAGHPGCEVRFHSKGRLDGEWDGDRLTQVIANLVGNAVQYGAAAAVSVTATGRGPEVVVKVLNRGPPIPVTMLKKIFNPMVRGRTVALDSNTGGLGLGLYIAREIVTAHGGTIGVTSTRKQGTRFTVHLPRHPAKGHARAA